MADVIVRKVFPIELKEVTEDGGTIRITTTSTDRDNDNVITSGAKIEHYMSNPIVLWAHDYFRAESVIGRTDALEVGVDYIDAKFTLRPAANPYDQQSVVRLLWAGKWINAASIGFRPSQYEANDEGGYSFTDWELVEWSLVPVGSNRDSLRRAFDPLTNSIDGRDLLPPPDVQRKFFIIERSVIPYKEFPTQEEGAIWDAAAARGRLKEWAGGDDWDASKYRQGFSFVDGDPEALAAYKGPHHDVSEGDLVTNWGGVRAAMGSLVFGSRGGRISDEGDRKGVYNHLSKHYAQFNKEVPEFREYSPEELKELFDEESVNVTLSVGPSDSTSISSTVTITSAPPVSTVEFATRDDHKREGEMFGSFDEYLEEQLKDPEFVREFDASILKRGRVLSAANENRIKRALALLQEVLEQLGSAEDEDDEKNIGDNNAQHTDTSVTEDTTRAAGGDTDTETINTENDEGPDDDNEPDPAVVAEFVGGLREFVSSIKQTL